VLDRIAECRDQLWLTAPGRIAEFIAKEQPPPEGWGGPPA
jgi:hypothetical protein